MERMRAWAAGFLALAVIGAPPAAVAQPIMLTWETGGCFSADAPLFLPRWGPKLDALMESYVSAPDVRARKKLFHGGGDRKLNLLLIDEEKHKWGEPGEWGEDGVVRTRNELLPIATGAPVKLTRQAVLIGGDLWSARGVWKAEGADGASQYVADLRREKMLGRWQIWRIRRLRADEEAPPLPPSYCYLNELAPLW